MNIEKVTYRIIKDTIVNDEMNDFILKMMISYLNDEQRGNIIDEIVNERQHIMFKKTDVIWLDPKDNMYELKGLFEEDRMKDAKFMMEGFVKGTIIGDTSYQDTCNPYAPEYKVNVWLGHCDKTGEVKHIEIRLKRSNIITLWEPKDLE